MSTVPPDVRNGRERLCVGMNAWFDRALRGRDPLHARECCSRFSARVESAQKHENRLCRCRYNFSVGQQNSPLIVCVWIVAEMRICGGEDMKMRRDTGRNASGGRWKRRWTATEKRVAKKQEQGIRSDTAAKEDSGPGQKAKCGRTWLCSGNKKE